MDKLPQWLDRALCLELTLCPLLSARDIYKLLFQAVLGPGHLLTGDLEGIKRYFLREWAEASLIPSMPVAQVVSPLFVRCHLAPLREGGANPLHIYDAFVRSAERGYGDADEVRLLWQAIRYDARWGCFLCEQVDFTSTDVVVQASPLIHLSHSEHYRLLHSPCNLQYDKHYDMAEE